MTTKSEPPFSAGDRVTLIASESLPASMVGRKAIVLEVEGEGQHPMAYHVMFRMDGGTPISSKYDTIADEYLDKENLRLGWDNPSK